MFYVGIGKPSKSHRAESSAREGGWSREQGAGEQGAGSREQGLRLVRPTARREPEGQTSEVRGRRFEIRRQQRASAFGFRRGAYSAEGVRRCFAAFNAQRPTPNVQRFNEEGFVARHSADRGQTSGVRRQMSEVRRPVIVRDSRLSIHVLDSRDHSSTTTKAPGERNTNGSAFALLGVPGSTPKDGNANNPDDDCGA